MVKVSPWQKLHGSNSKYQRIENETRAYREIDGQEIGPFNGEWANDGIFSGRPSFSPHVTR